MDTDASRSPEQMSQSGSESGSGGDLVQHPLRKLQREVLYPQRQNTGVGVMLVASAAMFFAVASSAFILRAKMPAPEHCPGSQIEYRSGTHTNVPAIETVDVELVDMQLLELMDGAAVPCGEPLFHDSEDGPSSIVFRLCGDQL